MTEVYQITHRESGKRYIGITESSTTRRWYAHCRAAGSGKNVGSKLHAAIRKYGKDAFDRKTLVICTREYACDLERLLIAAYNTYDDGYNATRGGEGTVGFYPTKETRQILSAQRRGKPKSPEHAAAIKAAKKGKMPRMPEGFDYGAANRGKTWDEAIVEKRAAAMRGRKPTEAARLARAEGLRKYHAMRRGEV